MGPLVIAIQYYFFRNLKQGKPAPAITSHLNVAWISSVLEDSLHVCVVFHQELTIVARELYQEMVTVTVDAGYFTNWAGQFVPKGYMRRMHGNAGEIFLKKNAGKLRQILLIAE